MARGISLFMCVKLYLSRTDSLVPQRLFHSLPSPQGDGIRHLPTPSRYHVLQVTRTSIYPQSERAT